MIGGFSSQEDPICEDPYYYKTFLEGCLWTCLVLKLSPGVTFWISLAVHQDEKENLASFFSVLVSSFFIGRLYSNVSLSTLLSTADNAEPILTSTRTLKTFAIMLNKKKEVINRACKTSRQTQKKNWHTERKKTIACDGMRPLLTQ